MKKLQNFSDYRQRGFCAYCGGITGTRDHVPSKVFLDPPYPPDLPVVNVCRECNQELSVDEEYVACLLECATLGSTAFKDIERKKIAKILEKKPELSSRLEEEKQVLLDNNTWFKVETKRIQNVVLKLVRGHAVFELNEPKLDAPDNIFISPFIQMDQKQISMFESMPPAQIFPEVGSRGMQKLIEDGPHWIIVQPDRYRYLTSVDVDKIIIKFAIREYLACEVVWLTN
jgi:hypothetical protein